MFFRSAYFRLVAYNGEMFGHMVLNLAGVVVFLVAYLSYETERVPMMKLQD